MSKQEVVDIAVRGTRQIRALADEYEAKGTRIRFQYSPESFYATEVDFALEICEAVGEVWKPTAADPIIFNLPSTVEMSTPNHYADMIEWFITHQKHPERAIISLHTHNDRGTGVAATELGLMAGATRVEGTLFGNGERTGNVDIVTLALNMYTQGVDPKLDFSRLPEIREAYERWTKLDVPLRWPYGGDLVFTAFSGSHQDAINKGLKDRTVHPDWAWEVPYLSIDPHDIGRNYRAIIRINSQSGKGGVAYVMEQEFGYILPKAMHRDFGKIINVEADKRGEELPPEDILKLFQSEYLDRESPRKLADTTVTRDHDGTVHMEAILWRMNADHEEAGVDRDDQGPGQRAGGRVREGADRERRGAVRGDVVFRAFAGQRRGGAGGGLLRDQVRRGPDDLRRGDEHEHRACVAEGDPERVESAGVGARSQKAIRRHPERSRRISSCLSRACIAPDDAQGSAGS